MLPPMPFITRMLRSVPLTEERQIPEITQISGVTPASLSSKTPGFCDFRDSAVVMVESVDGVLSAAAFAADACPERG